MKFMVTDNKIDNLLGSSGTFTGYSLMIFGAIATYFDLTGLILVLAGMFMAFTFDGTIIDYNSGRIKSYTCFFGLLKVGKWHSISHFNKFSIHKSKRSYTIYSRAYVPLTIKNSDIRLVLLNNSGSLKITIKKFNSFEAARKEMSELIRDLQITGLAEWL